MLVHQSSLKSNAASIKADEEALIGYLNVVVVWLSAFKLSVQRRRFDGLFTNLGSL